jgi:hypothetical protein
LTWSFQLYLAKSSFLVLPANHSTDCSMIIIIREWYNSPVVVSAIMRLKKGKEKSAH